MQPLSIFGHSDTAHHSRAVGAFPSEEVPRHKNTEFCKSLHSTAWTILLKAQHASIFAVKCAVAEVVCNYNASAVKSINGLSSELGSLGLLTVQRAQEKDNPRF